MLPVVAPPACLTTPVPALTAPARQLRFGITPQLAGTVGAGQGQVAPADPARTMAGLRGLQPPRRRLVVRLNRLFESDGQAGIDRFAALVRRYGRAGFDVESQVRYHPSSAQDGDLAAWTAYVHAAVRGLARDPALVDLTITNEVNLPLSANTSDGAYRNAVAAIVQGIVAARAELDRMGRPDVRLGFSYAYRYTPSADEQFWRAIGAAATPAFPAATNYVGVQLYPGLFYPPVLAPGQSAGDATLDALALVRGCYMPLAGLGRSTALWITENGYATNLGHTEARQVTDLRSTVDAVHRASGTLGVTDYRYFNLRDNRPNGTDLFDDVGLERTDYSAKPAFAAFRDLVAADGRPAGRRTCRRTVHLPHARRRYRHLHVRLDGHRVRAHLHGRRTVRFRVPRGRHTAIVHARRAGGRAVRVRHVLRPCAA